MSSAKLWAAGRCYQRLQGGSYIAPDGKKHPIRGDTQKLLFAEGTTRRERELLQNMHFVSSSLPGTQEVRRQMARLGFSARVVYGTGVFITISPSERHNGLAIRLSRYRKGDPLVDPSVAPEECRWIGQDEPRLEPAEGEETIELPDYDTRRLIHARDPLCAVDAFHVAVRVVLAQLLGIRMCPDCPHCNKGASPCQDIFGSNAEPQGGIIGRCDAIFGAVETQKSGTLHYHLLAFLRARIEKSRLHRGLLVLERHVERQDHAIL